MTDTTLSVLTTTHADAADRDGTLPVLLAALDRQSLPAGTELVVVDDGGEDATRERLAETAPDFDVDYVAPPYTGNHAANLNRAVERASGDLLLFVDCDTVPLGEECVRRAVARWEPGTILCGARQYWTPPTWKAGEVTERLSTSDAAEVREWAHLPRHAIDRDTGRLSLQEYTFPSNFGVVGRDDVRRVGGFDEALPEWRACDRDLLERLVTDGVDPVILFDRTEVLHLNHPHRSLRGGVDLRRERARAPAGVDVGDLFASPSRRAPGGLESPGADCASDARPALDADPGGGHGRSGEGHYSAEDVSVVVPTYDSFRVRDGSLELLLRALERQRASGFEVVVVDDGSTDRTPAVLERAADESPLDLRVVELSENTGNRALTRNLGAEAASNDLLVFVDDDTVPLSDAAVGALADTADPGTFLCAARRYWSRVDWDRPTFERLVDAGRYEAIRSRCVRPRGINWRHGYRKLFEYTFVGNLGVVPHEAFRAVDGFDADALAAYDHEDVDLMYRLYLDGCAFESLADTLAVAHLNHPIPARDSASSDDSVDTFRERERARGYAFKVNHLFGVYESDGEAVLEELDAEEPHSYQ
jgi:glycosyltransferase involved in cell wall biosynthesis